MNPEDHIRVVNSEFYGQTTVHPAGMTVLICLGVAMVLVSRKYAAWPLIFVGCLISPAQRLIILGCNFPFLRLMILFAAVRLLLYAEYSGVRKRSLDWLVFVYVLTKTIIYTLQQQTVQGFIYQAGASFDVLGMYVVFRCLVRSWDDLHELTRGFIFGSIPVAVAFLVEYSTGRNVFAFLGGVPFVTEVREGRLRCQGAFSHAILAGCYWAALLPLIAARWWDCTKGSLLTLVGMGACLLLVWLSASSTPVMAVVFAGVAACFYPLRSRMRSVRWGILIMLFSLHMVMKAPVWHLISRINVLGGSTGWHRYYLIDQAINRFNEWWLLGTPSTAHWGWGLWDVTNQFILEGVRGGFITLCLFVGIIAVTFQCIGRQLRATTGRSSRSNNVLCWGMGAMMFVHVTSFLAVSYFGQITMLLWMCVGISPSLGDFESQSRPSRTSQRISRTMQRSSHGLRQSVRASYR